MLATYKIRQTQVVSWHAKVTQIESEIRHLVDECDRMSADQMAAELGNILADLGVLRAHLPPVQLVLL